MNEPTPNCPGCFNPGVTTYHHLHDCPHITLEDALYHIARWKRNSDHWWCHFKRQRDEAQRWEGKFRVVKHENNQLRRKTGARYPATPSADIHQTTP